MRVGKAAEWIVAGLFILFLIWLLNLFLGISLGILGFIGTVLGAFLKLVFSKVGITLMAIALIVYILNNRDKSRRYTRHY